MKQTDYTNIIVKYRQNGHYYGMMKSEERMRRGRVPRQPEYQGY